MTTTSQTEPTKPKSKPKGLNAYVILIFIIAGIALFLLEFGPLFTDPSMSLSDKVIIAVSLVVVSGLLSGFAFLKKPIKRVIVAWYSEIFTSFVWPMLIFTIILLGAISVQYPASSYPNGTFQDNMNHSFSVSLGAVASVLPRVVMMIYDLGRAYPITWMIVTVFFIIMSLWNLKSNVDEHILQEMDAQEIIDSITDKDYKDLEKYEAKLAKRKPHWWDKKK